MYGNFNITLRNRLIQQAKHQKHTGELNDTINQLDIKNLYITSTTAEYTFFCAHETLTKIDYIPGHKTHFQFFLKNKTQVIYPLINNKKIVRKSPNA